MMELLGRLQALLELIQKRPFISLVALTLLLLFVFSPILMALSHYLEHHPLKSAGILPGPLPLQPEKPAQSLLDPPPSRESYQQSGDVPQGSIAPFSQASSQSATLPNPVSQPSFPIRPFQKDEMLYFVVVASKATLPEAIAVAKSYRNLYPAEVYATPNGWYAVTIGRYPLETAKQFRENHAISSSVWLSTGATPGKVWLGRVYP